MKAVARSQALRGPNSITTKGFSLVEIMVALVIGLVLIGGALQVYVNSRATYAVNESTARLQETARYAMSVLEPDIRMAGYWGLVHDASFIANKGGQTAASPLLVGLCGYNYIVDLSSPVEGANNTYQLGQPPIGGPCAPFNPRVSSDTLTVRHASLVGTLGANRYRLCTSRSGGNQMFDPNPPACPQPSLLSDLVVNGYYVSNDSNPNSTSVGAPVSAVPGIGVPSLRRKNLQGNPVQFVDQEVIDGVEDLQVQFGVDPSIPPFGAPPTPPGGEPPKQLQCGLARFYINPGNMPAAVTGAQIVSVRVWILVRADAPEPGFIDNRVYQYADRQLANGAAVSVLNVAGAAGRAYQPSGNAQLASFRRLLISRTFQIRNAEVNDNLATNPSYGLPCP